MVWPIQVAKNAPAMPRAVVRMNPAGLLGPGEIIRAMIPATKPTNMIQSKPDMFIPLAFVSLFRQSGLPSPFVTPVCGQACLCAHAATTAHSGARQSGSANAEQRKDGQDNHRQANEIDDAVHEDVPSVSAS